MNDDEVRARYAELRRRVDELLQQCRPLWDEMKELRPKIKKLESEAYWNKKHARRDARLDLALEARKAGKTYRQIGDLLQVSPSRAAQIVARAERRERAKMIGEKFWG